jgi:hydrogenase nickel incorporation protein HypB
MSSAWCRARAPARPRSWKKCSAGCTAPTGWLPWSATWPVRQITTGTVCHLEADMVATALEGWSLNELDFLFLENVGNLVCPATFDLGEDLRLVLFSVTEGEDKPLKYPTIFNTADVALLTKMDLAAAVEFDLAAARRSIEAVRPGMEVFAVSAKTGAGMEQWLNYLQARRAEARPGRAAPERV